MKIMVFENGEPGRRVDILGENVQAELEELLDGPVVWENITPRLHLVTRADARTAKLSGRYGVYYSGRVTSVVRGNAVVVKVGPGGGAKDLTKEDAETARLIVRPL